MAIGTLTAQGKLLDVNDTYCQMSGYSRNELLHMRIDDLEGGEGHEKLLAHIQQIVAKGFDRFETQHRKKNGELFDVEISATSLQATGQFLSFRSGHHLAQARRGSANPGGGKNALGLRRSPPWVVGLESCDWRDDLVSHHQETDGAAR